MIFYSAYDCRTLGRPEDDAVVARVLIHDPELTLSEQLRVEPRVRVFRVPLVTP